MSRPEDSESAIHYVDELARRYAAQSWDVTQSDALGAAIVAVTDHERPSLACLRRTVVTGARHCSARSRRRCYVVVAVDGAAADLALVEVAVSWAATLSTPLIIITVAEPAPVSYREGRPRHWARGPADPEGHVAALAARAKATWPGCTVDTRVAHDPISMRDGLVRLLDRTAALLVTGSHRRSLPMRSLLGSHAARVVHDFAIPALVVPLDAGGHRSGS